MKSFISIFLLCLMLFSSVSFASPNFQVEILDVYGLKRDAIDCTQKAFNDIIFEKTPVCVKAKVYNSGDKGSQKVESGMYKTSTLESLGIPYFAMVADANNCVADQTNVATKWLTLESGESREIEFIFTAPKQSEYCLFNCESHSVDVVAFQWCWYENHNGKHETGVTDSIMKKVNLKASLDTIYRETCTDGILNGDETDTDVGGSCPPAYDTMACRKSEDCQSNYCLNSYCATKKEVLALPSEQFEDITGMSKIEYSIKKFFGLDEKKTQSNNIIYGVVFLGAIIILLGLVAFVFKNPLISQILNIAKNVFILGFRIIQNTLLSLIKSLRRLIRV